MKYVGEVFQGVLVLKARKRRAGLDFQYPTRLPIVSPVYCTDCSVWPCTVPYGSRFL